MRRSVASWAILVGVLLMPGFVHSHDASTYGGLFRSRDQGQNWFSIDTGVFIGGALGIAVHPVDRNHLLMATDAGLLRSTNGGREWTREPQPEFDGPVFAVAFDASGDTAWAATTHELLRFDVANGWRKAPIEAGALPAQAIVSGKDARVYLAGLEAIFASGDGGQSWARASNNLPEGEVAAFARTMTREQQEVLFIVANAALWRSTDGARSWHKHGAGLPEGKLETIFARGRTMHALAQQQLYASDDHGANWRSKGAPLPETHLVVRGLAVSPDGGIVLVTTHKGLFRSVDGGATWVLKEGNLPIHLEAGPIATDPHDANTYYAGYALTPYGETWRRASDARAQRPQAGAMSGRWAALVGLTLLFLLSAAAWWFSAQRRQR
jgi:photosystem II stability/assembly factor-like uncharacterized protein